VIVDQPTHFDYVSDISMDYAFGCLALGEVIGGGSVRGFVILTPGHAWSRRVTVGPVGAQFRRHEFWKEEWGSGPRLSRVRGIGLIPVAGRA
jgi:hypothetical protein